MRETRTSRLSRRAFGAALAAAPTMLAQQATPPSVTTQNTNDQRRGTAPEVPPFEGKLEFTRRDVSPKASPFPMTSVRLLPGIYADAQEWNRGYMARLNADRLLYNFRANAGLPVGTVEPLGGWEMKDDGKRGSELRGHFTGHFL